MRWTHSVGKFASKLQALQSNGVKVAMLDARPNLSLRAQLALTVWGDLGGERAIGLRMGPIPWRAVVAWCDRYRVVDAESVVELVQSIDAAWLANATETAGIQEHSADAQSSEGHGLATVPSRGSRGV